MHTSKLYLHSGMSTNACTRRIFFFFLFFFFARGHAVRYVASSPLNGAPLKGTCSAEQSGESWQTASCTRARISGSERKTLRFSILNLRLLQFTKRLLYMDGSAADGGGQQGQFTPGPQCKGAPKQCRACSNKIRSSVTFQSSFFKELVSLSFRLKSACSFAFISDANNAQLSYVATAQSASQGPVREFLSDAHFLDLVSERKSMHSCCACALRQSIMGEP